MAACVPSRCSIFTGRYPKATRVRQNSAAANLVAPTSLGHDRELVCHFHRSEVR